MVASDIPGHVAGRRGARVRRARRRRRVATASDTPAAKVKVSWQVTGIRQDAYAEAHPMKVEQDKPAGFRGTSEPLPSSEAKGLSHR